LSRVFDFQVLHYPGGNSSAESLSELNEVLDLWLEEVYHRRPHGATGQAPFARYSENLHCIRAAPEHLADSFRHTARRRVAKDRTVVLNGSLYGAPSMFASPPPKCSESPKGITK
jgi:hypothetical protein